MRWSNTKTNGFKSNVNERRMRRKILNLFLIFLTV